MTPHERAEIIIEDCAHEYDEPGLTERTINSIIEAEYISFNKGKEEGYTKGYEKGRIDARCIIGAALTEEQIQLHFVGIMDDTTAETDEKHVTPLMEHIEYLTCLLIDLQQDNRSYRRGIQDGLKMVRDVIYNEGEDGAISVEFILKQIDTNITFNQP